MSQRSMRGLTKGFKSFLVSFAVVALVFTGGVLVLKSSYFHQRLLAALLRSTDWQVSVGQTSFNPFRQNFLLKDIAVAAPDGKTRVHADEIYINISLLSPLRGKIFVKEFRVRHPELTLPPTTGKQASIQAANPLPKIFEMFDHSLLLRSIVLDKILFEDLVIHKPDGSDIALDEARFRIAPTLLGEIELSARLDDASALSLNVSSLQIDLSLKRDFVRLKRLVWSTPKTSLNLSGQWKGNLADGAVELDGVMKVPQTLSGPLTFAIRSDFKGGMALFKKIEARLGDALLQSEGKFNLSSWAYDIAFTAQSLSLDSLFGKMPNIVLGPAKGIAEIQGHAQGTLPALQAQSNVKISGFGHQLIAAREVEGQLRLNWPDLDWDANVHPAADGRIQTTCSGGVTFKRIPGFKNLQGILRPLEVHFNNAFLQDLLPSSKLAGQTDGILKLAAVNHGIEIGGTAHAKVIDGRWPLGPINSLEGDVTFVPGGPMRLTNLDILLPRFDRFLWPGPIEISSHEGEMIFSGNLSTGVSVKGGYSKADQRFHIDSLDIHKNNSRLEGSGSYASGGRIEAKVKGDLNLEWLAFLPAFFRDAQGPSRVDMGVSGTADSPQFRGQIEFLRDEITFRGLPEPV